MLKFGLILILIFQFWSCAGLSRHSVNPGVSNTEKYIDLLKDKKLGLVVNHTSLIGDKHVVDFLLQKGMDVRTIFAPEHGFRGDVSAGEHVSDQTDPATGIPIVSLYGKNKKPSREQIRDLDVLVFDIQDVGCRFYTYISTMHLVMEACAENDKKVIVFDRPNPNGDYVAGPVLEDEYKSFVGMHPIPVVYGMTIGELALMINGEKWLSDGLMSDLHVVKCLNYTHSSKVELSVKPSPNLPNLRSVRLYPSLCFFEATSVSVGRGTSFPFQVLGGPDERLGSFSFTPQSIPGVSRNPLHKGKVCYGIDLREIEDIPAFTLEYFLAFYQRFENESDFLTRERWLNLLAGTDKLILGIRSGLSEEELKSLWEPDLREFRKKREKYLLYPDFQ